MRFILSLLLVAATQTSLQADDEPLIPPALNAVLSKISAGMPKAEVQKVLSRAYPKLKDWHGDWSGGTGYLEFGLDGRYSVAISAREDAQRGQVVHDDILIYIRDHTRKHKTEIRAFYWERTDSKSKEKG